MENFDKIENKSMSIDDFTLLKVVGKGSYGTVMLAKHNETGEIVAIKMLKKSYLMQKKQVAHTITERFVLEALNHPFIVQMKYAFQNPDKLYFCLEYCPGGEIFFHLTRVGNFDEEVTRFYTAQILLALKYLHSNDIIYRDLKPENVLIDADGYIKITDFGLSKANIQTDTDAKSFCGTPEYLAPEVLARSGYGKSVDWWSFGSIIFEMLTGVPPFYAEDREQLFKSIKYEDPEYPAGLSESCVDLLQGLLMKDFNKRLGCGENGAEAIMEHPWFSIVDWDSLYEKKIIPPFKPKLNSADDTKYVDSEFTELQPIDSATGETILEGNQASKWQGFTYEGGNKLDG